MAKARDAGAAETPEEQPAPQVSVAEWVAGEAPRVGVETAMAFANTYGHDTATIAELQAALAAFQARVIT